MLMNVQKIMQTTIYSPMFNTTWDGEGGEVKEEMRGTDHGVMLTM